MDKAPTTTTKGGWCLSLGCLFVMLAIFYLAEGLYYFNRFETANLLISKGMLTRATIVDEEVISCNKQTRRAFSVRFLDTQQQAHSGQLTQCDYPGLKGAVGASIIILYLPNQPSVLAPRDAFLAQNTPEARQATVIALIVLPLLLPLLAWLSSQVRKRREAARPSRMLKQG